MRHQGKITDWNDDKGFGFVAQNGGGARIFVHIKSFSNRQRRPLGGELVTYEVAPDARGRAQGVNIAFVVNRSSSHPIAAPGPGIGALTFAAIFLAFVAGSVAIGRLHFGVLIAYLVASFVAYVAYAFDKSASLRDEWRTPESSLHLCSLAGGWPGAMLAQRTLRHKTQKPSFQITYWGTVVLNCVALGWLLSPIGMRTVSSWVST